MAATAATVLTVERQAVDDLSFLADTYVEHWRALLTTGHSPVTVFWKVMDAVHDSPGLGLQFEECQGACGRFVWGADTYSRLVLCPDCRASAESASEKYLVGMIKARGRKAAAIVEEERTP